jgi:hypothetical protein
MEGGEGGKDGDVLAIATSTSITAKLLWPLEALSSELILNCFVPFRPQSSSSLSCHLRALVAILLGWDPVTRTPKGNIYKNKKVKKE